MADPILTKVHDWLRAHETELLADTRAMLRIPSLETEALPNAPFGQANRDALDLALKLGSEWGMQTTDLEGFCGYAEFGSGAPLIMSLGHLDVVPVGEGWKHEPFGAEIDGDYIYARGTVDDKGPTMASFYALRALQAVCPDLGVRFRQVFGCDEESGFKCVERYVQTEEAPTYGVAPDSGWPLVHGEKGITDLLVSIPIAEGEITLLECEGGERPNIVIDRCRARLRIAPSVRLHVEGKLADAWDRNVSHSWQGDVLTLNARGKAAHGSTPFAGDSAATRLFRFIYDLAPVSQETFFENILWLAHPSGAGLGILGADEPSGDLTSNLGIVRVVDGQLTLLFNIRYPVTWVGTELAERARAKVAKILPGSSLTVERDSAPLYFPIDHPLVRTICDAVEAETGERGEPQTMGGGTYARAVPNTVSIGTCWEGDGRGHEPDERFKIEHLYRVSRIYATIFYRLAKLANPTS
ncbi:MAG: Sapep family Mn(2+)-dependent dipeptidase [Fimbriimonas sp.]